MVRRTWLGLGLALVFAVWLAPAAAADDTKRCLNAEFMPGDDLQIVVWLETADGQYVDTLYVTQQTGSFGLGNRPGRWDFNSGPMWPYGRRINTFPVWAHRNGQHFPAVIYQDLVDANNDPIQDPTYCQDLAPSAPNYVSCGENDLSHGADLSSQEHHYCHPLVPPGDNGSWDAVTCPSTSFTDKGIFSTDSSFDSGYPPRVDLTPTSADSASVAMFQQLNPFDAVSQPTPPGGTQATVPWPVPDSLADGDYVLFVETSKEMDFNDTYNQTTLPSPPGLAWANYGVPARGQPSVVYSVPVTIGDTEMTAETMTIVGYGDPSGSDGTLNAPDSTISTDTPGAGAARLELVADGSDMYRLRVTSSPDDASAVPAAVSQIATTNITAAGATLSFTAPGIGSADGPVSGYDVRVMADTAITDDNFGSATPITTKVTPVDAGHIQTVAIAGLLPETNYWVGVKAYNGCHDDGPLAVVALTTSDRESGTVDACFIATAAYGSFMANDVETLRSFRDRILKSTVIGELGVEAYYTFGPAVAGIVGESDLLRTTARDALAPIVRAVRRLGR